MAADYSYLRPPCKSRSAEFYGSDRGNILIADSWSGLRQSISNFYETTNNNYYGYDDESEKDPCSLRYCASSHYNGSPGAGINRTISMPSYVLVAPTSCCYDTLLEPRVPRRPPPPPSPAVVLESNRTITTTTSTPTIPPRVVVKQNERPASTPTCVPWLKKIKVLKKIHKKIRIGSRGGGPSMSNLPPLLFNTVHGENINITDNGTVARRVSSFCKAIVFSDRPVKVNEKVCIKFVEVSTNWSGVLRFGFTNNDPSTLRSCLPRYACPDLTAKSGFWAKAFSDVHVKKDAILYYYVNQAGDVHFGINGEDKGVFFSGVDTRGLLWSLIDIYGNTTALEFVDNRAHLNNSRRSISEASNSVANDVNTTLVPSVNAMSLNSSGGSNSFMEEFPEIRYYPTTVRGSLLFHRTKGQHAEIGVYRCMAWRRSNEYSNGYVFTATPVQPGEGIVIQVLQSDLEFASSMAFGVTSCDPDTIQSVILPDDSHFLLDRPEYWVVKKDAANCPAAGDELCFTIAHSGEVLMSKNGNAPTTVMHVDNSIPLWAFFDVYGTTTKIFLLGKIPAPQRQAETRVPPPRSNLIAPSSSVSNVPQSVLEPTPAKYLLPSGLRPIPRSQSSTLPGSALSPLSLFNNESFDSSFNAPIPTASLAEPLVPNGNTSVNNVALKNPAVREVQQAGVASPPYSTPSRDLHNNWSVECVICCERPVDSVFYSCGHMCMCYQCATDYWKTKDKGWCPICRATITDVIRTYKS